MMNSIVRKFLRRRLLSILDWIELITDKDYEVNHVEIHE
jgi:hypothetical protein